ncbi:MAG: Ig-like domain-containing protein, partial [Elainellaceae cyanobacterium]
TAELSDLSGPEGGVFTTTLSFNEPVTGLEVADLTLVNATASLTGSGAVYEITLTPAGDGTLSVTVSAGAALDAAGNGNAASNTASAVFDGTGPGVIIDPLSGPDAGTFSAVISLSEVSTDFTVEDLTLTNATATLSGSGSSYIATLTPLADGQIALSVAAGQFTDAAGNANLASNEVTAAFDGTGPTAELSDLSGPDAGVFTTTLSFNEPVTGLEVADLTLVNATASLTGSGAVYEITLTPAGDGTLSVTVPADAALDAAGNGNTASNTASAVFDGTGPSVSIADAPEIVDAMSSFTVTITFSEEVTGFDSSDINVANADVTNLTGSGAVYQANLRASGSGDISIFVPGNVAVDSDNNGNLASDAVSIADVTVEETQRLIASFMQNRANQLIRSQPGLSAFLSGQAMGKFDFNVTRGQGQFSFASKPGYPVWAKAQGAWTSNSASESRYMFGALGSHRKVNENLLIGAMLQFDHMEEETGVASVSGTGWMVGPYFVAKKGDQPLYFEGRLLYGETRNTISPFGTYEDDFDTTRALAQFKVTGEYTYDPATTLYPFFDASYVTDEQKSYVDSLGNMIPEQGISLGQIEIGMDFKRSLPVITGELEVSGGVSGIWSQTGGSGFASTIVPDFEGGRGRVELGVNRVMSANRQLSAATFYDGIGASDFESFGLSLGYEMKF